MILNLTIFLIDLRRSCLVTAFTPITSKMFHQIFSKKEKNGNLISLKISPSKKKKKKKKSLSGKIVVGYCKGYETIMLFFFYLWIQGKNN